MSVPPIDPFLPNEPPVEPDSPPLTNFSTPPATLLITDSTSTASGPNRLSIIGYARAIGDPKVDFQGVENERITFNANNRNEMYASYTIEFLSFAQKLSLIFADMKKYIEVYTEDQNQVTTLNNAGSAYNSNVYPYDISQINIINQAIDKYNNGTITQTEYNAAVDNWNSYVNGRNANANYTNYANSVSSFNSFVSTSGSSIDEINSDLNSFGLANVPKETAYTGSANQLPTLSHSTHTTHVASVSLATTVTSTMTTTPATLNITLILYLAKLFLTLTDSQQQTISLLMGQSDLQGYLQFQLLGSIAVLPDSFITPNPQPSLNTNSASSSILGSGIAMTSIVASLSNPLTIAILELALYSGYLASTNAAKPVQLLSLFSALNFLILSRAGLAAGVSVPGLFSNVDTSQGFSSDVINLLLGFSVSDELVRAVNEGTIGAAVYDLLKNAFPGVEANTLLALALQITTGVELVLLLLGLNQLGQVLDDPSFYGKVIATLNAEQDLNIIGGSSTTLTALDILNNNQQSEDLKSYLTLALAAQEGISLDEAAEIIDRAVTAALLNEDEIASGNLGQQLINSLVAGGLSDSDAQSIGDLADTYVQAEINSEDILDQSISDANLSEALLSNSLVQTLLQNNDITTVRQLRDALALELAKEPGNTSSQALLAANIAVTGQPIPISPLSIEELRTQLTTDLTARLQELGETNAEELAQQIVNSIIGNGDEQIDSLSLAQLIDDRIQELISNNDLNLSNAVVESLSSLLTNTTDLWALGNWLRDPGNAILQTVGIDRTSAESTNDNKDVDIRV